MGIEKSIKKKSCKMPVILFVLVAVIFATPSIIYMIQNKSIYKFYAVWTYLFKIPITKNEKLLNAILFFTLFTILFLLYVLIIKKRKEIFKSKKQIFILILIISTLFAIIIPYTSTDVYSYIANGWSAAHYGENPYYVSTGEIVKNTGESEPMFNKVANCWRYETVVYGPLWTLICTVLSWLSFGSIDIALILFKFANLVIHLINCMLIYKITRRKFFLLLYGLNPFVLFEALSNVHNDILIVFFVLLAIYFTIRKKNVFVAVAFIAMATAIKYLAILILPFLVIYSVRNENIKRRIWYCIICGIEYIVIIALFYLIYMRDLNVLAGLFIQQAKYNRSIMFVLYEQMKDKVEIVQNIVLAIFAIFYVYVCIKLLFQKQIKFQDMIRKYNVFLLIFTFILITNFNPWYNLWLFPTMFWLKKKSQTTILALSYSSQIANLVSFVLWSEAAWIGMPYLMIMAIGALIIRLMDTRIERQKDKIKRIVK